VSSYLIAPVLEYYGWDVPAERSGNVRIKCFEHGETRASASINFDKNVVHCFGCDFAGDAIAIVRRKEGLDYVESVKFIEAIPGTRNSGTSTERFTSEGIPRSAGNRKSNKRYVPARSGPRGRSTR